jgi:type I restriction enzyme S subunit
MKEVELGDIAKFTQGQQISIPDQKDEYFENSDIFLRIINYTQHSKEFRYIPKQNPKYHVSKDDIIMVRYGAVGFVGRGLEGVLANNLFKISFDKKLICNDYLFRVLWSDNVQKQLLNASQSTSMAAINFKTVSKVKLPLPPLPQQQKIANILDAADALRQNDKALIAKYDELTQALFLDMFGDPVSNPMGWGEKSLNDLCTKITDGTHDTPLRLTEGIKFITGKHIRPFVIDYDNSDYVTEEVHNEIYRRCNPEYGDILYTNIGVNFATAAMNTVDYEFSMKNVALLKYKREFLNGRFLESILNNEFFKDRLKRVFGIGGAQQFLSLSNIKSIMILNPPLELQNQFAERVAVIEEQKAIAQKSLEKSEALFNSLLQKAFKGELV